MRKKNIRSTAKATSLKEQRILLLLYVYAEWLTENFRYRICIPTIIIAVRKICLKKIESKMSDDSVIECVILTYRRSYLPERMIYNRDANFYAAFITKTACLQKRVRKTLLSFFIHFTQKRSIRSMNTNMVI